MLRYVSVVLRCVGELLFFTYFFTQIVYFTLLRLYLTLLDLTCLNLLDLTRLALTLSDRGALCTP